MTSRPIVLVFLLLVLIITSQFEWKQQISEAEANPTVSQRKQQILDREEAVKEKIILSQEKNIRQLHELVQSLQRQLLHCRGSSSNITTTHSLGSSPTEDANDFEKHEILED
uniref:Uncharacterized protein n=1 Tax=Ananas comosus var. bracteatus TaxID=296719 RepID=A0A6V7NID5_ANACO|nr:unnamed protein product [Ananas comosus var. bracteatus]CAD1818036.1 unnamed protein product [Ananas comosus var. bracteatus]